MVGGDEQARLGVRARDEIIGQLRGAGLTASVSSTVLPDQYIVIGSRHPGD
ncbi:MAG TPA: hypothetical protein VF469_35605 [Kofleriaceae bacterium]